MFFKIFTIILLLNLMMCSDNIDFTYPFKLRLNNGNYLVIASEGIYMYNPTLTSKINVKIFDSPAIYEHKESYPTNIVQFSSENNGYIICLLKNETYIVSKDGNFLTQYSLDYINKNNSYPIIPYGHLGNEYYYTIISAKGTEFTFRKYIYNSVNNSIIFDSSYNFTIEFELPDTISIACELMNYSSEKVIICFYGNWTFTHFNIYNINDFSCISELTGIVPNSGGQFFKSKIISSDRNKVACCSQHEGDLKCFIYNIDINNYSEVFTIVENRVCDIEPIDILVEYFPEREEIVFGCINHFNVFLGRLTKDNNFEFFNFTDFFDSNNCSMPKRINFAYSSDKQKYTILTDTNCTSLYYIELIEAEKIYNYPIDEVGPLICNNYSNYQRTECINVIPHGYYCNDTTFKTINKCHENCETCEEGPNENNNNCLSCKNSKFLDLGNCIDKCINGYFTDIDDINKCKCSNNIKCFFCSEESKEYNLCLSCNNQKGYYQKSDDEQRTDSFINCYKNLEGYYLDNNIYKPCYPTCKKCYELGNEENNKCIECINTHEFKNYLENSHNCYEKCDYYYYIDSSNLYHCTVNCPNDYNKLIIFKKKCIDNCINDDIYKYEYQNYCYQDCPPNTISSANNIFICQKMLESKEQCKIIKNELNNSNQKISKDDINSLTKEYAIKYIETNYYISQFDNDFISIYIYKNISCLENTIESAPIIDFGSCYEKLREYYKITEDLIVSLIKIKSNDNSKPMTTYTFSDPLTGEILNSSKICANESIIINEDVKSLMENLEKKDIIIFLTNQGIDVFNISDRFYNDLCYLFESPYGKDIPLKDRISVFFPNITLCDKDCENIGVDLKTLKAKCQCSFIDLMSSNLLANSLYKKYFEDVVDLIDSLNIEVLECINYIFVQKYFIKCYGAYNLTTLFLCKIICIFKFTYNELTKIQKYFASLINSYFTSLQKNKTNDINNVNKKYSKKTDYPPKRRKKKNKSNLAKSLYQTNNILIVQDKNYSNNIINNSKIKFRRNSHSINLKNNFNIANINYQKQKTIDETKKEDINIKEFLSMSFDEDDFDDVIDKEKRVFSKFFLEKLIENHILINSFIIIEPIRPRSLKILILFVKIELYLVINALFYNEDYLSDLFYKNEEDSFLDFVPRRIDHFIYTSTLSNIITYLIDYFFVEEKKIKKIFIRNKEDINKIKSEISTIVRDIKNRFIGMIVLSICLSIISFIYISCFNIVYPYIKIEWIKSSVFIIIFMIFFKFLCIFIECCLRYMAIKLNSEKLFKLSLLLS